MCIRDSADAALAAAALFDGEHSADLALGGVFSEDVYKRQV